MRYRDSLVVQKRKKAPGSAGQRELVNDGSPVTVVGNMHPLDTSEIEFYGTRASDTRKWFCKSWPGDMFSEITYDGAKWDQVDPEKVHKLGQATRHIEVIVRKR